MYRRPPAEACSPRGAQLPASFPLLLLRVDQRVAHQKIPAVPLTAAHVVHGLGAVVPVVNVGAVGIRRIRVEQVAEAFHQGRIFFGPAQVDAAQQGFGRHRRCGALAGLVSVQGAVLLLALSR